MMSPPRPRAPQDVRDTTALSAQRWDDSLRGAVSFRTAFGGGEGDTDTLTAGVAELPRGSWLASHRHAQAEIYYVISGSGTVILGDQEIPVGRGSAVFIPGGIKHGIRNDGPAVLEFFYTLASDSLEEVDYEFVEGGGGKRGTSPT